MDMLCLSSSDRWSLLFIVNSASTTAPSRSFSIGGVATGDHRSMMAAASSGTAVEVYSVLLVDSVNFEGNHTLLSLHYLPCDHVI